MEKAAASGGGRGIDVPRGGSQSAARAAALLQLLGEQGRPMSLTQIATSLGLAKSSTLGLLVSLEHSGLLRRSDNDYGLGYGVVHLASGFISSFDVVRELHHLVGNYPLLRTQIVQLAVLTGRDVTFLGRHTGRAPLPVTASVGERFPAAITAIGTALLAELKDTEVRRLYSVPDAFTPWTGHSTTTITALLDKLAETRAQGYAVDRGETHPNVLGLGVAVHCASNHAQTMGISVSLRPISVPQAEIDAAVTELRALRDDLEVVNRLDLSPASPGRPQLES